VILLGLLAIPLAAALLTTLPRSERVVLPATTFACFAVLGVALASSAQVLTRGQVVAVPYWIEMDGFTALMELAVAFVAATAALYSWGHIAVTEGHPRRIRAYTASLNLFVVSLLAVPLIVEPGASWMAVGATTLFSVLLVSFENTREALEAAWKYMTITLVGATIAVLGILILFWAMRSAGELNFTFSGLVAVAPRLSPTLLAASFVFILVGFGAKVGLVPMHTWLPDAHSQAPSPVCAMLSGVETSVALYVILRLVPVFRVVLSLHVDVWLLVAGLVSLGAAAFLILQTHDYKRLFAFSTVEHMGIVLIAVGIGSGGAAYGAAWQLVAHAITKSFCFYGAGLALARSGTRLIAESGGLVEQSKLAATALFIGSLAIAGAPPFAVFLSELAIARAGFAASRVGLTLLMLLFIAVAFFGILGRTMRVIFGSQPATSKSSHREPPHSLTWPVRAAVFIAGIPVIVLGVWIPPPLATLFSLAGQVLVK
jgi:hydrogenase-4 component F